MNKLLLLFTIVVISSLPENSEQFYLNKKDLLSKLILNSEYDAYDTPRYYRDDSKPIGKQN